MRSSRRHSIPGSSASSWHRAKACGGRYAGASTAAMFVGEFAGDTPWVHLDIAGTRWSNEEKPYRAKGPTGHGVPTLVHLLMNLGN